MNIENISAYRSHALLLMVFMISVGAPLLVLDHVEDPSVYHTTKIVSEDPSFSSLVEEDLSSSNYELAKKGKWVLSGRVQYDNNQNLIVHPIPEQLSREEDVQDTSRSGVKQAVQLPNSEGLEAVLSGRNAAHLVTSNKQDCTDSRLVLEVRSLDTEEKLIKSKVVNEEREEITLSLSEFAGEKVEVGGYGHYGDAGCGEWSGEFTGIESLHIQQKKGLIDFVLTLFEGQKNQVTEADGTDNYTGLEGDYKVPSGEDYPEIKHRARWWREIEEPPYRILKPGYCQLFGGWSRTVIEPPVRTCINEEGYRGKQYNKTKTDNDFRIMAVGDAVTFGQGVPDNETYPAYLENHLNADSDLETNYQVINYGFPSWNTRKEIQMFERHGVEYNPDLVVLQYMENDAQRLELIKQELIPRYYNNLSQRLEDDDAARVISQRTAYDRERQERMNQSIDEEMENVTFYFERLDNLSEEHDFDVLLMHYSTEFSTRHKKYVREEAERLGWYFFDSNLARSNYTSEDYLINPYDDFYLNSLGYNLTARQLKTYLKEEKILN